MVFVKLLPCVFTDMLIVPRKEATAPSAALHFEFYAIGARRPDQLGPHARFAGAPSLELERANQDGMMKEHGGQIWHDCLKAGLRRDLRR